MGTHSNIIMDINEETGLYKIFSIKNITSISLILIKNTLIFKHGLAKAFWKRQHNEYFGLCRPQMSVDEATWAAVAGREPSATHRPAALLCSAPVNSADNPRLGLGQLAWF